MFFKVKTTEEVLKVIGEFASVGEDRVPVVHSAGRVLCQDIVSCEDLPGFHRSSMDGYAVKAKDTFGATEGIPALFEIVGEVLMGQVPGVSVMEGQAVRISTGGMLPKGADGVVMIEYCQLLDEKTLEITRAISPQENVILPDDDIRRGSTVLFKGTRLRPQDVGVIAGLGLGEVPVHMIPRVAVVSTGDEVVPPERKPGPGQVRDINTYTLSAFCQEEGAEPILFGLCADEFSEIRGRVEKALAEADTVWISGGSSVGTRDLTVKVLESFPETELLVHGVSISPGKPTIIARVGRKPVFGLPGHVASAMVVAEVFLKPLLARLSGERELGRRFPCEVEARLGRNVESAAGREDYIRVRLQKDGETWAAEPVFGKSGLISPLVDAHGLVRVERNTEGLYQGQKVKVILF